MGNVVGCTFDIQQEQQWWMFEALLVIDLRVKIDNIVNIVNNRSPFPKAQRDVSACAEAFEAPHHAARVAFFNTSYTQLRSVLSGYKTMRRAA